MSYEMGMADGGSVAAHCGVPAAVLDESRLGGRSAPMRHAQYSKDADQDYEAWQTVQELMGWPDKGKVTRAQWALIVSASFQRFMKLRAEFAVRIRPLFEGRRG